MKAKHIGCTIEGCTNKHYARTWCRSHYELWRRYGQPQKPDRGTCAGPCDRPEKVKGYCTAHYWQWKQGKELKPLRPWRQIIDGHLQCKTCGWQPVENFYKSGNSYQSECKACQVKRNRINLAKRRAGVQE